MASLRGYVQDAGNGLITVALVQEAVEHLPIGTYVVLVTYPPAVSPNIGDKYENVHGEKFEVVAANRLNVLLTPVGHPQSMLSVPQSLFSATYVPLGT